MDFSDEQIKRYSRQLLLQEITGEGQKRLFDSEILVVGVGGLGSALLMYLVGCGIGRIGIVDSDVVDLSNLSRQILFTTSDIGKDKVEVAKERLSMMNPEVRIDTYKERLTDKNAKDLFKEFNLIVDCTDNFETRFLINKFAVMNRKPLLSGAVVRFEGHIMLVIPGKTFCYNCVFGEAKPDEIGVLTCSNIGVLGSVVGTIATIMATEAIKFLLKLQTSENYLIVFDGLKSELRKIRINKNPQCLICKGLSI